MRNKKRHGIKNAASPTLVSRSFLTLFLSFGALILLSQPVYAVGIDTPMGFILCSVGEFFYGNLGRGLSSLAIIVIGIGALLGKASWGLAITVGVGVAAVFGAPTITLTLLDSFPALAINEVCGYT